MTKSGDEGQQFCLHHVKFELPVKTSKQRHGVGISSPKITLDNISPSLRERSEEALASWIIKRKETLVALLFLCHVLLPFITTTAWQGREVRCALLHSQR